VIRRSDTIRHAKDNPPAVIQAYFDRFLFQGHAYGRPASGDELSVTTLTREEMGAFWKAQYRPDCAILSVAGDLREEELLSAIDQLFSDWTGERSDETRLEECPEPRESRVLLVDKPDTNQSYFRIGGLGIERTHPDYVQLQVLNTIFGGRFTSRLNAALRINSGLTYGARSFFSGQRQRGYFSIASYTPTETTGRAVDLALEQLLRLHSEGVGAEELASVKTYIHGQFPPTLETTDQLAGVLAELELFGQDASFINGYLDQVDALDSGTALQLVQRHFPSRNLVFAFIGQAEIIGDLVARYGPVTRRTITEPGF
jgi:zinc protease